MSTDTIFALSSAAGKAGVSVFRISGAKAGLLLSELCLKPLPKARRAVVRNIFYGDAVIDEAMVIYMPGPQSFTGEDCVEIQCHGSLAVIEALAKALSGLGARAAEAGEFTRRALLNGKMDLTEVEGLADLIDSETEGQRVQAVRQMQGGLKTVYEGWRSDLIDALAMIEGEIDFPDEGDVPDALSKRAGPFLAKAVADMRAALETAERGERIRSGIDISLIGATNAGKSSLLNALSGREAAIISPIAGTTRDIIEVQAVYGGLPVRLSDTAGLRHSEDIIELEGIKRAQNRASESDIRLWVVDGQSIWNATMTAQVLSTDAVIVNKSDLNISIDIPKTLSCPVFTISALHGEGIGKLEAWISDQVTERFSVRPLSGLTRLRHQECVGRAVRATQNAIEHLSIAAEISGEEVRSALNAIKELAGETDMDAVFDRIFSRFCIGK